MHFPDEALDRALAAAISSDRQLLELIYKDWPELDYRDMIKNQILHALPELLPYLHGEQDPVAWCYRDAEGTAHVSFEHPGHRHVFAKTPLVRAAVAKTQSGNAAAMHELKGMVINFRKLLLEQGHNEVTRTAEQSLMEAMCTLFESTGKPDASSLRSASDRDLGGRIVREAWMTWARQQPNPKPSWLVPYDDLSEADKEADRQVFEACVRTQGGAPASFEPTTAELLSLVKSLQLREPGKEAQDEAFRPTPLRNGLVRALIQVMSQLEREETPETPPSRAEGGGRF